MTSLFDQDHVTKNYVAERERQSRALGRMDEKKSTALRMKARGYDSSLIADILNTSLSVVQGWFSESSGTVG